MQTIMQPYPIEGYTVAEYESGFALKHGSETIFWASGKGGFAAMIAILSEAKLARRLAKEKRDRTTDGAKP